MNKKILIIGLCILSWVVYSKTSQGWIDYDKKVIIHKTPSQLTVSNTPAFTHKGFTIIPQARFDIEARVLSKHKYFIGREAKLSRVDLALGWGPMSNYHVLKDLKITQSNRWYHFRYKFPPPVPKKEIIAHSGNMHLIPANKDIAYRIAGVKRGQIVKFKGYLVNVNADDGWRWRTSLSRTDSSAHSCELVWVESFRVL